MPPSIPSASETTLRRARTELETGLRAGRDIRAESFLDAYPVLASDSDAALELIYSEYVVREEMGQSPSPEEWIARFPRWKSDLEQMFEVHNELRLAEMTVPPWSSARSRPTAPTAAQGERIGDFEILGELGRGGMGVVYKARQTRLNRTVALKLILSGSHAGPKERDRFQREVESAAKLDHPNIVRIFEVGEHEGRPFCAMEYVGGGSLADRIDGTPWPSRAAAELMAVLARAAHHAHQRGIVHRDLKPANILVASDSVESPGAGRFACIPKIADFGLAKCLDDDGTGPTRTGDFLGTPAYMAPEQADGNSRKLGPGADIWALGVVLYEMLTGRPPFRGDSGAETMELVRKDEPVQPRRLRSGVPRDLETIALKCLGKLPSDRYADAEALAEDLERFLREEPIRARPLGAVGRFQRWCRRSPRVAILTGAVAGLCLAAIVLGGIAVANLADARVQANKAATSERKARIEEAAGRTEDRRHLARLQLIEASRRLDQGDPASAAVLFAAVLKSDPDPSHETIHRIRLGAALRASPRLVRSVWESDDRAGFTQISGDGSTVISTRIGPGLRVLDTTSGESHALSKEIDAIPKFTGAQLSDNGRVLVVMDGQGEVTAWDTRDSRPVTLPLGPDQGRLESPFSSNGSRWIRARLDGRYLIVGSARGVQRRIVPPPMSNVHNNAISPDGRVIATLNRDATMNLWDAATCEPLGPPLGDARTTVSATHVAFSHDGARIVCSYSDGMAQVWDVATGKKVGGRLPHGGSGHMISSFSPEGGRVVTFGDDLNLRVWNAIGGEPVSVPIPHSEMGNVRFSLDGTTLAVSAADDSARAWDIESGLPVTPILTHGGGLVRFFRTHNKIVTAGQRGAIRIWEIAKPNLLNGHVPIGQILWMRDNKTILASTAETRLWDSSTNAIVRRFDHNGAITSDISPDGSRILTLGLRDGVNYLAEHIDGEVRQWDSRTGKPVGARFHPGSDRTPPVYAPDGRIVTTYPDGRIRFWNADTGKPDGDDLKQSGRIENGVRFSPDGRRMLAMGAPSVLWDVPNRRQLRVFRAAIRWPNCSLSPDGKYLTSLERPGTLHFYNAEDGEPLPGTFAIGDWSEFLTISADGRRIAAYSRWDRSIQVWDRDLGKPAGPTLRCPRNPKKIAFSPDGKLMAQGSQDGTVTVWDIASGMPVAPAFGLPGMATHLAFSPSGNLLAVAGSRGTIRVLDLTPDNRPVAELEDWAELLSDHRLDDRGELVPLTKDEHFTLWNRLAPGAKQEPERPEPAAP